MLFLVFFFFFFKQKTAYEMRISDWSSDVCSSDLARYSGLEVRQQRRVSAAVTRQHIRRAHGMITAMQRTDSDVEHLEIGERRVGKECVSTCRSRWSPYH